MTKEQRINWNYKRVEETSARLEAEIQKYNMEMSGVGKQEYCEMIYAYYEDWDAEWAEYLKSRREKIADIKRALRSRKWDLLKSRLALV